MTLGYSDLYDRWTVDECRRLVDSYKKQIIEVSDTEPNRSEKLRVISVVHNLRIYFVTGKRAEQKVAFIRRMQEQEDREKRLVAAAQPKNDVQCFRCHENMPFKDKYLYDAEVGKERVVLFYACPNECLPKRVFFDDGTEYFPKPRTCEKCQGAISERSVKHDGNITIVSTCELCGYKDEHVIVLSQKEKEEKIDDAFAADRERYCLNPDQLNEYRKGMENIAQLAKFMKDLETDKNGDRIEEKIKKIQKIRIAELLVLLQKVLEGEKFMKVELSQLNPTDGLRIKLTAFDAHSKRLDRVAVKIARKVIETAIQDTNWRITKSSVTVILGVMTAELRGYVSDMEIRNLVEKENKSIKKGALGGITL